MPPILLGVGPVTISVVGQPGARPNAMVAVALDCLDDPVAVLDDRAVSVDDLLVRVLAEALGPDCAAATVVHPTWWPRRRVERVRAAAAVTARAVTVVPRSELLRRHRGGDPVVVEIAADCVAVCRRGPVRIFGRRDLPGAASLIAQRSNGTTVLVDAPDEVPGAEQAAADLRKTLADNGIAAHSVDLYQPPCDGSSARGRPRRPWIAAAAAAATAAVAVMAAAVWPDDSGPDSVRLVEGRVAVEIPPGWAVRRVTDGPGSRRVEVTSPTDDQSVLHITSAYTPGGTLAEAAAVLERVAAAEPAVFGDFVAAAQIAGRPALTYREVRPGRVVDWAVVLDGAMRIGIGCQSAPGREQSLGGVCAAAIVSARDIGGTARAPAASN